MSEKLNNYFNSYDEDWLHKFLLCAFGKYSYSHTASQKGLNTYFSNLRSVHTSHPDDLKSISFVVGNEQYYHIFNMVDFTNEDHFIYIFNKYYKLKAFL